MKKLRSKQRKRAKQEALRRERERAADQRREAQRAKNPDAELDAPREEELVPDKLQRVRGGGGAGVGGRGMFSNVLKMY